MLAESTLPTDDLALNVARGPRSGPPLVLFHGVTRRWQDFLSLIPALACRWQIQALDFRGHGRSGRTPGRYLVVDYVRDAVAFLRRGLDEPAVVYGHSLGAMVAAAAAAEAPDAVRAVVLEDPPFETLGRRIVETPFHSQFSGMQPLAGSALSVREVAERLADVEIVTPGLETSRRFGDMRDPTALRFSARCLKDLDPEVLAPLVEARWLDGYDLKAILPGVKCPALLLLADYSNGGMLPEREAQVAASLMADCSLIGLPRVGHLIHWAQPEATLRLVTGFLEAL